MKQKKLRKPLAALEEIEKLESEKLTMPNQTTPDKKYSIEEYFSKYSKHGTKKQYFFAGLLCESILTGEKMIIYSKEIYLHKIMHDEEILVNRFNKLKDCYETVKIRPSTVKIIEQHED